MERFNHLPETHYNPKKDLEFVVGDIIERAEVTFKPEAWIWEYERGKLTQSLPISQHSADRNHPRQLLVYVIGVVHEGHDSKLAYTEDRKPNSPKHYTVRLTNVKDITDYARIIGADDLVIK